MIKTQKNSSIEVFILKNSMQTASYRALVIMGVYFSSIRGEKVFLDLSSHLYHAVDTTLMLLAGYKGYFK